MTLDNTDIGRLLNIFDMNARFLVYTAAYLQNEPRLIDKTLMDSLLSEGGESEYAFGAALSVAFGLDGETSDEDYILERRYMERAVKRLDASEFQSDPYYKNIKLSEIKLGNWEIKYEEFAPYEGLIFDDIKREGLYEMPQIGFFEKPFVFPAVLEGGREWMMITPNEINTMKEPIKRAFGKVLTYGLGMGYFAYMASRDEKVESVTVVEKEKDIIDLFEKHILPEFEHKDKINIVHADAFEYAKEKAPVEKFDYAFVDIWHDALDGLDLYIGMKKLEKLSPGTVFDYWAEKTLLCSLRRMVFEQIEPSLKSGKLSYESAVNMLSDEYLKKLTYDIRKI